MKKTVKLLALFLIAALTLASCSPLVSDDERELSVFATFYPIYALTDALVRDVPDMHLSCLVQPQDGCLRDYQLSDWDAYLLAASADAVIAGGRGLESFEDTLFGWGEAGPAVSAILYNLELYNKSTSHVRTESESHLEGANPHLYMSLAGAKHMIEAIAASLMTLDPRYAQTYADNQASAIAALDDLIDQTNHLLKAYSGSNVILMNEALIYVARDYGFEVAEWIDRESGVMLYGTDLEECLEKLSNCDAGVVLIERQAPAPLIERLENRGFSVAAVDIMSTHREGEGFEDYIRTQLENAEILKRAFDSAIAQEDDS